MFRNELKQKQALVELYLDSRFAEDADYKVLLDAMRYSLLAGGKRLRPVLCLSFCEAVGGDPIKALPGGCAIEMVHTYSLIHDDLPCMDDDDYRRGKLTCHKVYGEDIATLAGDALLTAAFSTLADMEVSPKTAIDCVRVLSNAAGETGMVAGQVLDLLGEKTSLDETQLRQVHIHKTGDLIRAACQMGVLLGGGSLEQYDAAGEFALHLGMAFQIRDDMLDEIGSQDELGKPIGSDADNHKSTFVSLLGLEKCQELVECETKAALDALREGGFVRTDFIEKLSEYLIQRTK